MQHPAVLGGTFAENILKIEAWKPICQVEMCRRQNPGYRDAKLGSELSCPTRLIWAGGWGLGAGAEGHERGRVTMPAWPEPSVRTPVFHLSLTVAASVVLGIWKTTRSASSREVPSRS